MYIINLPLVNYHRNASNVMENKSTKAQICNFHTKCDVFNPPYRDAMILPIVDVVTSVFAGCVVFVTLGFMAEEANVTVEKVVDSGIITRVL